MKPSPDRFRAALAQTEKISPAPRTLSRTLRLLRNPDSSLEEVAQLISSDPGLAADVLRCANSVFYGSGGIAAIGPAVQTVGFRETIRLVSLAVTRQTTHRNLGSYGIDAEDFWAESLFNGLFLEALCTRTHAAEPDEGYVAGLLRFIGRLAINQTLHDVGGGLFWDSVTPLVEWELENVGLTQAEAGGLLLRQWQFPDNIVEAVASQDAAGHAEELGALAQAMRFATRVLPAGLDEAAIDALPAQPARPISSDPFLAAHGLTVEVIAELITATHERFATVRQVLFQH